ncbi:dnaJ homolog subfamily C member 9 [Leptopilina heterotoma]|uniref:dnaJ homolog subfamily C member 9 n=1 Tax=Leptopilina heterotoma TaxID=63436 RepID=UPI001CAA1523|nr:dnaJ homolog subfamily C member 9 [Leptopilina heterotoma]
MAGLLDLCEKYFGARELYEVLEIPKTADQKQVKKAYHKLSLLVHPDRVEESVKVEATEKFKVLGRIHSILSDNDKRKIYDETGQFDEESDEVVMRNWADYWRTLFKPITVKDIKDYEETYKGSEAEIKDLKRAYMDSKGNMDYILEAVPFTNCDEEPRLHDIIQDLIAQKEVPEYKAFTQEDEKKKQRRRRKWAKEAEEAERLEEEKKASKDGMDSLVLAIQSRNKNRGEQSENFFDSLIEKYSAKAGKKSSKRTASNSPAKSPSKSTRKNKKKA